MRLDEKAWIFGGGTGPDWRWVAERRVERGLADLRRIAEEFSKRSPAPVRRRRYLEGIRWFLSCRSPARDRLVVHPAFDYWLFLWEKHFSLPCGEENWHLQFGLFQGLAASLAVETGETREFDAILDPDGHFHFYGAPFFLAFPKSRALKPVQIKVRRGRVVGAKRPRLSPAPGVTVETCGLLSVQGVVMHGLAQPKPAEEKKFAAVLSTAFSHIRARDPELHAEMTDMVRVLVPLVNPVKHGSVSSSYVNMRGAICLSHADDPLLQAETLIHEFCHQKMNQLLLVEPVLLPGQGGQVFFSPWRPDARRLRGLILGAHAFLNVANYLLKSLSREEYDHRSKIAVMGNIAKRLYEVEGALGTACAYGIYTEFGRRFILGMLSELTGLFHGAQWFPPALLKEARERCEEHRAKHALPLTGLHKSEGFQPAVRPIPFKQAKDGSKQSA